MHNGVADGKILTVSSQQFTVDRRSNINDRTRPGLFACGQVYHNSSYPFIYSAAGDGQTTADQQFFFNSTTSSSGRMGFPLVQNAINNGINQCLTLNVDGFLSNTLCSPPNFTPEQSWVVY